MKVKTDDGSVEGQYALYVNGSQVASANGTLSTTYVADFIGGEISVQSGDLIQVYARVTSSFSNQDDYFRVKDLFIQTYDDYVTLKESALNIRGEITVTAEVKTNDSGKPGNFAFYVSNQQMTTPVEISDTSYQEISGNVDVENRDRLQVKGSQTDPRENDLLYARNLTIKVEDYATEVS